MKYIFFLSTVLFGLMHLNGLAMDAAYIVIDPNLLKQDKSGGVRAILSKIIPAAITGNQLLRKRGLLLTPSNIKKLKDTGTEAGKRTKGMFNILQQVNPIIEEITKKRLEFDEVMKAAQLVSEFMPHINQETKDALIKIQKEGFKLIFASNRDIVEHVARMQKEQTTSVAFNIEEIFDHIIVGPTKEDNLTDLDKKKLDALKNNINKDKTHTAKEYNPSAEYFALLLSLVENSNDIHWLMGQREYTELEKFEKPKDIVYTLCKNNKDFLNTLSQLNNQKKQAVGIEELD